MKMPVSHPGHAPLVRRTPAAVFVIVCALCLGAAHFLAMRGFSRGLTNDLVGRVLLGVEGKMSTADMFTAYPPITYLSMLAVQAATGVSGVVAAQILSAVLAGALAWAWVRGLLRANYTVPAALGIAALLVCNPIFMRALAGGPEIMLALWGTWVLATSMFGLKASGGVNELILCSASLIVLVFTAPLGAALAVGCIPFLLLAVPRDVTGQSYPSVYLVLLFPVLFCLLGFIFVNWLLLHDPLAFIPSRVFEANLWLEKPWSGAITAAVLGIAVVPILLGLAVRTRTRRLVQAPALALLGTLLTGGALAILSHATDSPAAALGPAAAMAAAASIRWPQEAGRTASVALLLLGGSAGGVLAIMVDHSPVNQHFRNALTGTPQPHERRTAEADLGHFLAGRADVLFDATAYPAVVAARGTSGGLVTSVDTAFDLSLLRRRIEAREVVVAAPDPARTADTISRGFPDLYQSGAPGFRLAYDGGGWRVWSRNSQEEDAR